MTSKNIQNEQLELNRINKKLPLSFYQRPQVEQIAKELLGKLLVTKVDGLLTAGTIVETEAYSGRNDKACHANNGKRTKRTEIFYQAGGVVYVYLIYGMHQMFNIVTHVENQADAVLIRAIEPLEGIETMLQRRKTNHLSPKLTAGPGILAKALGISKDKHYGVSLISNEIWVEDQSIYLNDIDIIASPRVGVSYAQEDALRPWRFRLSNNKWTSPAT